MNSWTWNRGKQVEVAVDSQEKDHYKYNKMMKPTSTAHPDFGPCLSSGDRRCADGRCIARVDLCPEEQMMNQNTILIMIVVGMAVVIFLIILYCFQQRSHRNSRNNTSAQGTFDSIHGDGDNTSLNMPPPTYDEVVNTNLYPATPVFQRSTRMSSSEEPRTPPPNYDTALDILAHSQDSVLPLKEEPRSPVVRRSVSTEFGSGVNSRSSRSSRSSESDYRRLFSNPEQR